VTWEGEKYLAEVEAQTIERLGLVGQHMTGAMRVLVGVQGSRKDRSKPGEPPRKQTGGLYQSMGYQVMPERFSVLCGSPLEVDRYLELGTVKMAPRPHLRRALANNLGAIRSLLIEGKDA
jgi:hypothetical protein